MVVVPARNEGPRIGPVLDRLAAALPGVDVVVVANGCTDDTVAQAEGRGVPVILSAEGYAPALLAGLEHALRVWGAAPPAGAWLCQLDADGQHPPEALSRLVAALTEAHVVIGSRWAGTLGPPWMPRGRRWGIWALSGWARLRAGLTVRDVTSGMQACRAEVVPWLVDQLRAGRVDTDLLVAMDRAGHRLLEVPVQMAPRQGGESQHGGLDAVGYGLRLLARVSEQARVPRSSPRPLEPWQPAGLEATSAPS